MLRNIGIPRLRVRCRTFNRFGLRLNLVLLISGAYLLFLGVFILASSQILNMGLESYLLGLIFTVTGGILGISGVLYTSFLA